MARIVYSEFALALCWRQSILVAAVIRSPAIIGFCNGFQPLNKYKKIKFKIWKIRISYKGVTYRFEICFTILWRFIYIFLNENRLFDSMNAVHLPIYIAEGYSLLRRRQTKPLSTSLCRPSYILDEGYACPLLKRE